MPSHKRKTPDYRKKTSKRKSKKSRGLVPSISGFNVPMGNPEIKSKDTAISVRFDTTAVFTLINGMSIGAGMGARVGRQLRVLSLELSGYILNEGTAATHLIRYGFVVDNQCNGTSPTSTALWEAANVYSPRNLGNRHRFKTLVNKMQRMGSYNYGDIHARPVHIYLRFKKPYQVTYNSGSGNIGDISTGSIHFYQIGTATTAGTSSNLVGTCRMRYSDM